MRHRIIAVFAVFFALALGACGEDKGPDVSGGGSSQQASLVQESSAVAEQGGKKPWSGSGMTDEQIGREAQKLKDKGIVDEHGVPAPGVDLNDYPGLG